MTAFESIRTIIILPNNELYCALSMQSNELKVLMAAVHSFGCLFVLKVYFSYYSFILKYLQLVGHHLLGEFLV